MSGLVRRLLAVVLFGAPATALAPEDVVADTFEPPSPRAPASVGEGLGVSDQDPSAPAARADRCARVGHNSGFRGESLVTAVAVALAESGCNLTARGTNGPTSGCPNGSVDRGLWQINDCYHPEVSDACAYDAQCNADATYRISSGGTDWRPWTTYRSGVYRRFLDEARAAVDRLRPPPNS